MSKNVDSYPVLNRMEFMKALRPYFSETEMENIEAAYFFSKYAHRGQKRANGLRYFEHPRAVAWMLFYELYIYDWQIICIALLHDMIEDSYIMRPKRLEINFGHEVAMGVKYMTKEEGLSDDEYWVRLLRTGDWRATMCKLADRMHNLRTLQDVSLAKQKRKLTETKEKVYPLFEPAAQIVPKRYVQSVEIIHDLIEGRVEELEASLRTK